MNLSPVCVTPETSVRQILRRIDEISLQVALVVDEDWRLLGGVTRDFAACTTVVGVPARPVMSRAAGTRVLATPDLEEPKE